MKLALLFAALLAGSACTRPNPAVCCLDEADCQAAGISEVRTCAAGLACVDRQCVVPSCAETGCAANAPVCNVTTDVCDPCIDAADCARFADTPLCESASGACVQCVAASDCPSASPICEANECRACARDSECASGACGDDGACVVESEVVYLNPGGADAGTCTQAAPCRSILFAVSRTSATRAHIVMAPGGYTESPDIASNATAASRLYIHGGGATLTASSAEEGMSMRLPSVIRDLNFVGPISGYAVSVFNGTHTIERIFVDGASGGVGGSAPVTVRDAVIANALTGISASEALTLERVTIRGGGTGISVINVSSALDATNVLIYGQSGLALDIALVTGTIQSSTIADAGTDSGAGPRAVRCGPNMTLRSSIVWAPGSVARAPLQGCNVVNTIAGPTAVGGAMNVDPMFVDSANSDFHLAPNSPARDAVDTGPATDVDGDARPQGVRFDVGADEALP